MEALAWASVAAVFVLMILGNVVSATGSGLACPDWPLCHGRIIPPFTPAVLIEYGHRVAALLASVMLVTTIAVTMRRPARPGVRRIGVILLFLLAIQILLGGVTVRLRLPGLVSTAHLVDALLIFGGLLLLAGVTGQAANAPSRSMATVLRLAVAGTPVLLIQLALGGYVRHSGTGLACPDFPLCAGQVLPAHVVGLAPWTHRWLGVALLGLFLHLALVARGTPAAPIAATAAALAVLQVGLGIAAVLLRLEPAVRAAHAAVGYALWGAVVWLGLRSGAWDRLVRGTHRGGGAFGEAAHAS